MPAGIRVFRVRCKENRTLLHFPLSQLYTLVIKSSCPNTNTSLLLSSDLVQREIAMPSRSSLSFKVHHINYSIKKVIKAGDNHIHKLTVISREKHLIIS